MDRTAVFTLNQFTWHWGNQLSKAFARRMLTAVHGTDRAPNVFHPMFTFVRAHHRALIRHKIEVKGMCVDVGSGDRYFERFYRGAYQRYIAIDYLPILRLEEGVTERRRGREFVLPDVIADGGALPLLSSSANTVLLIEVLEHVRDPGAVLAEVFRILKPGGRLLLTTPFALPEHAQPHDYYRYTQFGLRHLFETAGFRVRALEQITSLGGVISYFLNMFSIVGTYQSNRATRWAKALCAPLFPLMWAMINIWALGWDSLFAKDGFTLDYFVLGEKPAR